MLFFQLLKQNLIFPFSYLKKKGKFDSPKDLHIYVQRLTRAACMYNFQRIILLEAMAFP